MPSVKTIPNAQRSAVPFRSRWTSRGALLIVSAALTIGGTAAYAGPSITVVVYRLLLDGACLLPWLAAAYGLGSGALRWMLGKEGPNETGHEFRFVTAAAIGLGIFSLSVLALGLAGWLGQSTAIGLIVVGVALACARHWPIRKRLEADARRWLAAPAGGGWFLLLLVPFLVLSVVGALLPAGVLWSHFLSGEPHGYDVVEYHLQIPREWFAEGRIRPLPHNVFSFFPFNVEMNYLLADHLRGGPWAAMYLAQLMHLSYVTMSIAAIFGVARRFGNRTSAIVATLAAGTVPWLTQLGAVAYDEGGLLLYGTLAVGWILAALSDERRRWRAFAVAGALAGFACGAKLTAVPEVLATGAAAIIIVSLWGERSMLILRAGVAGAAVYVIAAGLTFGPWLARNAVWAGNPLFPEAMHALGRGHFTPVQQERWERAHAPRPDQRAVASRLRELLRQVLGNWQFGYVLFPLAGVGAFMSLRSMPTRFLLILASGLVLFWLSVTHLEGRFFVLGIPIAALLAARIDWQKAMPLGIVIVVLGAAVAWHTLNGGIVGALYGREQASRFMGVEVPLMTSITESVPRDDPVILIGDARAFWYDVPMLRLKYRTVFDVNCQADSDLVKAWEGSAPIPARAWLVIAPDELERFHQTYWAIPRPPPWIGLKAQAAGTAAAPFVIRSTDAHR